MRIMYPLISQVDYTELKYSLRSVERFLPEMEVIIVGPSLPDWITNITHINLPDIPGRKQLSIRRKILAGLEYSDTIFFMNDDHCLLTPTNPGSYPYYYSGDLSKIGEGGARPLMNQLQALNKPILHYDTHTPIVYEREKFKQLEVFSAECIIKSMYCNYHEVRGKEYPDCKINKKTDPTTIENLIRIFQAPGAPGCISTGSQGLKSTIPILQELYPNKSRFEL